MTDTWKRDAGGPEGISAGRPKWAWLLQSYDGLKLRFRVKLSPALTEHEIETLLTRLAARHLTSREVIGASLRKRMNGYNPALEIRKESRRRVILSIGHNPHYTVSAHTALEFADMGMPFEGPTPKKVVKVCPECQHTFQGNGWDGIDAHWKAKHEKVMPYAEAWPMLKAGTYRPRSTRDR